MPSIIYHILFKHIFNIYLTYTPPSTKNVSFTYNLEHVTHFHMIIIFYYILIFFFGLSMGSFLNAWIYRSKSKLNIITGRSHCTHCHTQLTWYENIPVISFVCLKGKCKSCKEKISIQYPLVEIITACLFIFTFWFHSEIFAVELARDWYIIFILLFIFIYDLKYQLVLDKITLPASLIIFVLSLIFGWNSIYSMSLAALIGSGFFLFQYIVSKGRWIGGGDIRIGLLMGIILGFPNIILALFLAYIIGAITSIAMLLAKKATMKTAVPFGIYLTTTTFICIFYGNEIVIWYLNLLGI